VYEMLEVEVCERSGLANARQLIARQHLDHAGRPDGSPDGHHTGMRIGHRPDHPRLTAERAPPHGSQDAFRCLRRHDSGQFACPSAYDLGENLRAVLLSTTEGKDKPLKYPTIFRTARIRRRSGSAGDLVSSCPRGSAPRQAVEYPTKACVTG
jgi:hypothetical protein